MKRAIIILFITTMLFQVACGNAPSAASEVDELIAAIGYVDVNREDKIIAAEAAYNALSEADKANVEKYSQLAAARKALEKKKAEQSVNPDDTLAGDWVLLRLNDVFAGTLSIQDAEFVNPAIEYELRENGNVLSATGMVGKWTQSDDDVIFEWENDGSKTTYKFFTSANKQLLCENGEKLLIKRTDLDAFMSEVFVKVQLTPENADTYLVIRPHVCDALDELGVPKGKITVTTLTSGGYAKGLVFYASSGFATAILNPAGNSAISGTNPFSNVLDSYPEPSSLGNVTGTLYFIRSQYASCSFKLDDNSLSSYHRQISLFNGLLIFNDTSAAFKGINPIPEMLY